jgi:hypothetical protein
MISNIFPNNTYLRKKKQPSCSFCKNIGHNVSKCDDSRLSNFKSYLFYIKNEILLNDPNEIVEGDEQLNNILNKIHKITKMEEFLYEFIEQSKENIKIIKTFACRFCSCRLRSRIQVSINKIIVFLFELNYGIILTHVLNNYSYSEESPSRISTVLYSIINNHYFYNELSNNNNNRESEQKNSEVISEIEFELYDSTDKKDENIDCPICYNEFEIKDCLTFNCKHNFCSDCSIQLFKNKHINCPSCRSKIIKIYCYNDEIIKKLEKNKNTLIIDAIN